MNRKIVKVFRIVATTLVGAMVLTGCGKSEQGKKRLSR